MPRLPVPRLPPGGSLGTPKILGTGATLHLGPIRLLDPNWECRALKSSARCRKFGVPYRFFSACKWGFYHFISNAGSWNNCYSLSRKTVNARENFWNVYCFMTNQMRDKTAKDNRQTAEWINYDLTRNNEFAFSSTRNFNFAVLKYRKFSFSISVLLSPKNRYERHFTEKRS